MAVKISDVSICSTALLELGSRPINSFNENNEGARLCSNLYESVRDEQLRSHTWNFAKKRVVLAPDTTKPAFGYANAFTLPADFLRLIEVNGNLPSQGLGWPPGFTIENGKILANTNEIHLRYVYRNELPGSWDASFVRVMIAAMKRALVYSITRDANVAGRCDQDWALAMKLARTTNGFEIPPAEITGDSFISARY